MSEWHDILRESGLNLYELEMYDAARDEVEDSAFARAADAAIGELVSEVIWSRSWNGVRSYLERTYPEVVFTGEGGDIGRLIIALLRGVEKLEEIVAAVED